MVYIDLRMSVPAEALQPIGVVLNERLAGRSLREIRGTLSERLRDSIQSSDRQATELLEVFIQGAEDLFESPDLEDGDDYIGRTSVLADLPMFARTTNLKRILEFTNNKDLMATSHSA